MFFSFKSQFCAVVNVGQRTLFHQRAVVSADPYNWSRL